MQTGGPHPEPAELWGDSSVQTGGPHTEAAELWGDSSVQNRGPHPRAAELWGDSPVSWGLPCMVQGAEPSLGVTAPNVSGCW